MQEVIDPVARLKSLPPAAIAKLTEGKTPEQCKEILDLVAIATGKNLPALEGRPVLHIGQTEIKSEAARFNVVNCGRRWGKSVLGENLVIDTALTGKPVGWFSPDYKSLTENWRSMLRLLQPVTARRSELEKRIELTTGGVIECWSLDSDPECSRGRKYARVIIDEAAKVRWLMRAWLEAIRANLADYQGDAWFFSTPKGRNDYWELYQRGADPLNSEWRCWKKPTGDNPYILPVEIEAMRSEMGNRIASQEIDAEFLEVGGRFFDEWMPSDYQGESPHEVWSSSITIPDHWRMEGGFDHGTASPCSFLLHAVDESGNIYVVGEYYEALKSNADQIIGIKRVIERWGRNPKDVIIHADPAIFPPKDPTKRVGRYTSEDFWDGGLKFVPANNERVEGWKRVKQYMRSRYSVTGTDGEPRILAGVTVFKDRCPNLIRTIPLMVATDKEPEDCDSDLEDHAVDSLRYAIQRPRSSQSAPPKVLTPEERRIAMQTEYEETNRQRDIEALKRRDDRLIKSNKPKKFLGV